MFWLNKELVEWWKKPLRVSQILLELWPDDVIENMMNDFLSPKRFLEDLSDHHVNVLVFGALDCQGRAFYNSAFAPTVDLKGRDMLAEYVNEAHKIGIKIVAYLNVNFNAHIYKLHPEWVMVNSEEGTPNIRHPSEFFPKPLIPICSNTPYRNYFLNVIREIVENYDVDGVFLDCMFFDCGYCSFCKDAYGATPPVMENPSDPNYRRFIEWKYRVYRDFAAEIRRAIKEAKPDIPVMANARPYEVDRSNLVQYVDILIPEMDMHPLLSIGDGIRRCLAVGDGMPIWMPYFPRPMSPAIWHMIPPSREGVKELIWEIVMNGASPWLYFQTPRVDLEPYDEVKKVFSRMEAIGEYLVDTSQVKGLALLYSTQTQQWYGKGYREFRGRGLPELYEECYKGFYQLLLEKHILFNVIADHDLTETELSKYSGLILPNAACLSAGQIEAVRRYVEAGGRLLATYETSLYDEFGNIQDDFRLGDVLGMSLVGREKGYTYLKVMAEHPVTRGLKVGTIIPCGDQLIVKKKGDATTLANMVIPLRGLHEIPTQRTENPALLVRKYGKGRVVYLASKMDRTYWHYSRPDIGNLLFNCVRWIADDGIDLEVEAPITVEVNMLEQYQMNRRIIMLLNHSTNIGHAIYKDPDLNSGPAKCFVPINDIKLKMRVPKGKLVKDVSSLAGHKVAFSAKNGWVIIELLQLDDFDLISVQMREQ